MHWEGGWLHSIHWEGGFPSWGEASLHPGERGLHPGEGGPHPGGSASRGRGVCIQEVGGSASTGLGIPPEIHGMLSDTVNERAVRILLECILVNTCAYGVKVNIEGKFQSCRTCKLYSADMSSCCRNVEFL